MSLSAVPTIAVGIMTARRVRFTFQGPYAMGGVLVETPQEAVWADGQIAWGGARFAELCFTPQKAEATFSLDDVTIGVGFHWERRERQTFGGALRLVATAEGIVVVNDIGVEDYLKSVIASEMSGTSSLALLKAHAVISRSWVMRHKAKSAPKVQPRPLPTDEHIVWYESDAHTLFDVCADDHCQRYQGLGTQQNATVTRAVDETYGQVLTIDGEICDARFSKCCGGITERFSACWADEDVSYLHPVADVASGAETSAAPSDISPAMTEEEARRWILSKPDAFCHTTDKRLLAQVLNDYDQETTDFFRWTVGYSQEVLSALLARKSGVDFGRVTDLVPLERGASGRIVRLRIVGTKRTLVVGKELEIRRLLSDSHLYSSAFVVSRTADGGFVLHGAGWGHGVGLCQIGAAVMASQGYGYEEILSHYYRNCCITELYTPHDNK